MRSALAILTYRRCLTLQTILEGLGRHCPFYPTAVFEDCGQRDNTADVLQLGRKPQERPDLLACEYVPDEDPAVPVNYPNVRVFMGERNVGVAGVSNKALKWFMEETDADHLCLCNDDLLVNGDFVKFYAQGHADLGVGMFCFCVAGNTPLITKAGLTAIQQAAGRAVRIWNGQKWAGVVPRLTGRKQKLYRVRLSDGSHLDCTGEHAFSVKLAWHKDYRRVMAKDLMNFRKPGSAVQCEQTSIKWSSGRAVNQAYTLGFAVGDGHWAKVVNPAGTVYNYVHVYLYGSKVKCPLQGKRYEEKGRVRLVTDLTPEAVQALKDDPAALDDLFAWDRTSIIQFVAGMADADGSDTSGGGIRITLSGEARAQKLQLLLTLAGIKSTVGLDQVAGSVTNIGVRSRDQYYVQITDCKEIPCFRLDVSRGHVSRRTQTVESVEELPGFHDVYCFTEPERHKGFFSNVLTYQCDFTKESPAISGKPETYRWTTYRVRGYGVKFLPRFTGIMISITRKLVEQVGYFDAEFGQFGEEHPCPAESPVWMGDYTFKPISQIKTGDTVIGWSKRQVPAKRYGKEKRDTIKHHACDSLQKATVLGIVQLQRPLIEVKFASGRSLRCASEHTWLNYHGVKPGNQRYIKAEVGKRLVHVVEPQSRNPDTLSYVNGYVHGLVAGDGGIDHGSVVQRTTSKEVLDRLCDGLKKLAIRHSFAEWDYAATKPKCRRFTDPARVLTTTRLDAPLDFVHWEPTTKEDWRGWLAGVYDADGYGRSFGQCPFTHPDVYERIVKGLTDFGFGTTRQKHQIYLKGGWRELTRFWNLCQPVLSYKLDDAVLLGRFKTGDKIVKITELAGLRTVYCLKTTTGNYVIQGYASKNCDYTIRCRFAGGLRLDGQDMNCLDLEHALLSHQECATSVTGDARARANQEASVVMEQASRDYRWRHFYRPFRLAQPALAGGYSAGGIPVRQLFDCGYKLVQALV